MKEVAEFFRHLPPAKQCLNDIKVDYYGGQESLFAQKVVTDFLAPGADAAQITKLQNLRSYKVPQKLPTSVRMWAKSQDLKMLRALVIELAKNNEKPDSIAIDLPADLDAGKIAKLNRSQVQNYLCGLFDATSKAKFEQSFQPKAPKDPNAPKVPKAPKTYSYSGPVSVQQKPQVAVAGIMVPAERELRREAQCDGGRSPAPCRCALGDP